MVTPAQKLRWGAQHFSALPVPSGTTPRILFLPFLRHALRLFLPSHPPSGVLAFKNVRNMTLLQQRVVSLQPLFGVLNFIYSGCFQSLLVLRLKSIIC